LISFHPDAHLVMFDMDWTLINVTDSYGHGMDVAIRKVYGMERRVQSSSLAGNTMANIMRTVLRDNGLGPDQIEPRLEEALRVEAEDCVLRLQGDLRPFILPGVVDVLQALRDQGHWLAVVSGTLGPISRVVLRRSALDQYFPVAVFGEEGEQRPDLLRLVISRARQLGFSPTMDRVVAVGDTTHDITAAKVVGTRVVAVATGHDTPELLAQYGPDAILPNLVDREAALDAILNRRDGR
jgi:phosphoglycolate phosphatase